MNIEFYDQKGNVNANLFDTKAQEIAKKFIMKNIIFNKKKQKNEEKVVGVSRHQLRKIFDEVKRLEKILEEKNNWDDIYPLIKLIKSKVAYSTARARKNDKKSANYYSNLSDFIKTSIDKINTKKDYNVFCLLFEAVYGFYYELGGSSTN